MNMRVILIDGTQPLEPLEVMLEIVALTTIYELRVGIIYMSQSLTQKIVVPLSSFRKNQ